MVQMPWRGLRSAGAATELGSDAGTADANLRCAATVTTGALMFNF
jgi:hypothetical protein